MRQKELNYCRRVGGDFRNYRSLMINIDGKYIGVGQIVVLKNFIFIYVLDLKKENLHRQGLGTKGLKEIEKIAREKGIFEIVGEVLKDDNEDSLGFWKKMGFTIIKKKH